jgi:ferredoxin-NADP reductase
VTIGLLLAWILSALVLQLVAGIGFAAWRGRGDAQRPAASVPDESPRTEPGAWPRWREFRVGHREFEDEAQTQCSFYLQPVDGAPLPPYSPGQFLTFALKVGDRTITRCYSLSDRPDPARYRITVKRIPAPTGTPDVPAGLSSGHFHDHVQTGSVLEVKAPAGQFCIDHTPDIPAVFIAGGIGITPMFSMLRWCLTEQPGRTLHLYYGVRCGDEHAFKGSLEQFASTHPNLHLHVAYSRPAGGDVQGRDYHHAGHVNVDLLRSTLPHGRHRFYVCGPTAMMESLVPALADWGVARTDIHYEAFGPASVRFARGTESESAAALAVPVEVRFLRSGRTLAWEGREESLLEFAERHGVEVESGCRSGSCGTCETKLLSGDVRYAHGPDHIVAPGHCLLCVGVPASALVLEA